MGHACPLPWRAASVSRAPCGRPGAGHRRLRHAADVDELTEALRALGPRAALSHHDAARAHGIELVDDDGSHHATVPRNFARPRLAGWRVHRADIATVTTDSGLLVAGPLATVCGLARVLPLSQAVAAADSAVRRGLVSLDGVTSALRSARGAGAGALREVARLLGDQAGSVLESVLRVLIVTAG